MIYYLIISIIDNSFNKEKNKKKKNNIYKINIYKIKISINSHHYYN